MTQSPNNSTGTLDGLTEEQKAALAPLVPQLAQIADLIIATKSTPPSPIAVAAFETRLADLTRQLALFIMAMVFNSFEPTDPNLLPKELFVRGACYRRRHKPTRWTIDCLFGSFKLSHFYYEPRYHSSRCCLHPLCEVLGIVSFCTPGLAQKAAELHCQHPQNVTLQILVDEYGVDWSVERLRDTAAWVDKVLSSHRLEVLADCVVAYLEQAGSVRQRHYPVLAAGRDGITMPLVGYEKYKEASVATITVYDGNGQRLGTVYLGQMPETNQKRLTEELTDLITRILKKYTSRKLRLAYVTDAGYQQKAYYEEVLQGMKDPTNSKKQLHWHWVVDYYHAAGYVTKLAEGLFGESGEAKAWASRMRKLLKEPNGAKRVLQAAGYQLMRLGGEAQDQKKYDSGWGYLHNYAKWMDYQQCKRLGIPLGSGVTEAGCKVIVTQRMKNSGMKWATTGGQIVLNLRTLYVSKCWQSLWDSFLRLQESSIKDSYSAYTHALANLAA